VSEYVWHIAAIAIGTLCAGGYRTIYDRIWPALDPSPGQRRRADHIALAGCWLIASGGGVLAAATGIPLADPAIHPDLAGVLAGVGTLAPPAIYEALIHRIARQAGGADEQNP